MSAKDRIKKNNESFDNLAPKQNVGFDVHNQDLLIPIRELDASKGVRILIEELRLRLL